METSVELPSPSPADSDTVVTALEMAAVFKAKGDTAEAIRWLQRAAESASEAGDDRRTLAFAQVAAELTRSLQAAPHAGASHPSATESTLHPSAEAAPSSTSESGARRLPKPPARVSSLPPEPGAHVLLNGSDDDAAKTLLVQRPEAMRTPTPSGAQASSTRPPPPSMRTLPTTPSVRAPSNATASSTPLPSAVAARPRHAAGPRSESQRPSTAQRVPSERASASATPAPEHARPRLKQAARVSVSESREEPGLLLVRILADGQDPNASSEEGFLLLSDPNSKLFSG